MSNDDWLKERVQEHATTLRVHDDRIKKLETSTMEIHQEVKTIQASLAKFEVLLHTLNRDVVLQVGSVEKSVKLAIADHESREFARQRGALVWVITSLLTAIGAVLWAVIEAGVLRVGP